MAHRIVDENSLKTVADAIREKAGTSDSLVFPTGFAEAIAGIQAGGGNAGGGGVKVTTGTIVPLARTKEIVHGLGAVPDYFIFYVEDSSTATVASDISNYVSGGESRVTTPDIGISGHDMSLFFSMKNRELISRTTFDQRTNWGFYTLSHRVEPAIPAFEKFPEINENAILWNSSSTSSCPFPYSADGAWTIRWFAIAGV